MRIIKEDAKPIGLSLYLNRLQNERIKLFGTKIINYERKNLELVKSYLGNKSKKTRDAIILLNLTMAHEMMYKKLSINVFKHDTPDILQELNLATTETVDKILERVESKKMDPKHFGKALYWMTLTSLRKIGEGYYNYSAQTESLEDPDVLEAEIIESREDDILQIKRYSREALSEREGRILELLFLKGIDPEEIGFMYGLTRARISQIREKACRELRDYIEESQEVIEKKRKFRKTIYQVLKANPRIKYVLVNPEGCEEIYSHETYWDKNDRNLLLDEYLHQGINPWEWLIVSPRSRKFSRYEYNLFKTITVPEIPFKENKIFDKLLLEIIPTVNIFPYYSAISIEKRRARVIFMSDIVPIIEKALSEEEIKEVMDRDQDLNKLVSDTKHSRDWIEKQMEKRKFSLYRGILLDEAVTRINLKKELGNWE